MLYESYIISYINMYHTMLLQLFLNFESMLIICIFQENKAIIFLRHHNEGGRQ